MATGFLACLIFVAACATEGVGHETPVHQGTRNLCASGRQHVLTYNAKQRIRDEDIVSLNANQHVSAVQCDLDGSKVKITFATAESASGFCSSIGGKHLVGGGQFGCINNANSASTPLLKRALECAATNDDSKSVIVQSAPLPYSQIYDKLTIAFHTNSSGPCKGEESEFRRLQGLPTCPSGQWCCLDVATQKDACIPCKDTLFGHCNDLAGSTHTQTCADHGMQPDNNCSAPEPTPPGPDPNKKICVGVNADKETCTQAARSIPMYSNQYLDVSCANCFAGFRTYVFFNIDLDDGYLLDIEGGFRETGIAAAIEVDANAHASWSVGVDKDIFKASDAGNPVIHFSIGPIPFMIWFEASGHIKADLSAAATAEAKVGIFGNYSIGDNYVSWDPKKHWQHHYTTQPNFTTTPTVSGDAQVKTHADVTFTAMAGMHLDQIFSTTLMLTPTAQMDVTGHADIKSTPQVCEDANYDVKLELGVKLHIDLPFHLLDLNKDWSTVLWEKSGGLPQKCQPLLPDRRANTMVVV